MKKLYKVDTKKCDACEGKYVYDETEYVNTADINAYIEAKRVAIENTPYWWMNHRKVYGGENDGRPLVVATALDIIEA